MDSFAIQHSYLIPLLPLLGAAVAGFLGARWLRGASHWAIWITVGISAVLSLAILWGMVETWRAVPPLEEGQQFVDATAQLTVVKHWYNWISAGEFTARAAFLIDPLTAVMLCVVCGIGFLITVFSKGYMAGEGGYFRFFAYLGLFIFAMTILVLGDNLVMLYLGWEGVGLCSYLLIGHYYERPAAREAAKKAFLVNRIGDFGFGLGIMLIFLAFGTVSYFGEGVGTGTGFLELAAGAGGGLTALQRMAVDWAPFLLMLGAFGKSAQFPLYVWLPDAMEGPTPVSALIHAATMVTAGVYMIVRCGPLFIGNEPAMWTVAIIGAFTAIFAATIALRQFDLKKVFAYSTISQLGFMFVGVGVLAPVTGIFHLVTHAFFKALLFLASGVVMHAMLGELDMRKFSGLKRVLPVTRWLMLIGCLALAGFPFLSGFLSKDEIVIAAWERSALLGLVLLVTAFLTAYYTFRLYFRVFEGPELVPAAEPTRPGVYHEELAAHASESAVATGTTAESGVDEHLMGREHHAQVEREPHLEHDEAHAHGHEHAHSHEPASMMVPLIVLAVGAVFVGYINWPWHKLGEFLGQSPSVYQAFLLGSGIYGGEHVPPVPFGQHEMDQAVIDHQKVVHFRFMVISGAIAVLGIYLAYLFHLQDRTRGERLAERFAGLSRMLEAKYWVDEVYQNAIVEPLRKLGRVFFAMDRYVVDGIVWGVSFVPQLGGFALKLTTQRGYLQGYALSILFAIAVILLLVFL